MKTFGGLLLQCSGGGQNQRIFPFLFPSKHAAAEQAHLDISSSLSGGYSQTPSVRPAAVAEACPSESLTAVTQRRV